MYHYLLPDQLDDKFQNTGSGTQAAPPTAQGQGGKADDAGAKEGGEKKK